MRALSFLLLLTLTACGFQPLYGTGEDGVAAQTRLAEISIDNIPDRRGQELRLLLSDRFYGSESPAARPSYKLKITLQSVTESLGIQRDDVATRARMTLVGTYELRDAATSTKILAGRERAFVSYNILTRPYATIAAEDDAYRRGLERLANLITSHLSVAVSNPNHTGIATPLENLTPLPGETLGEQDKLK